MVQGPALKCVLLRWELRKPSYSHRYLHSAVAVGGLMLVYGGNTHNDTQFSQGQTHSYHSIEKGRFFELLNSSKLPLIFLNILILSGT